MTRDDRCPVCDRPLASVVDGYPATGKCRRRSRHAIDVADCDANAVDWREHCQAAEAGSTRLLRERDYARDQIDSIRTALGVHVGHALSTEEIVDMARAVGLADGAVNAWAKATSERDEARAEADAAMWAHAESLAISDMCSMAGGPERTSTEHLRAEYPQHAERLLAERTKTDVK